MVSEISSRMTFILRPTHVKQKKGGHVHILQSVTRSQLVSSAKLILCPAKPVRQSGQIWFSSNRSNASKRPTALVYEHSQVLSNRTYLYSIKLRHRAVVGSSSNRQGAISQCSLGYSLHIDCFSPSLSLPLSTWSILS